MPAARPPKCQRRPRSRRSTDGATRTSASRIALTRRSARVPDATAVPPEGQEQRQQQQAEAAGDELPRRAAMAHEGVR